MARAQRVSVRSRGECAPEADGGAPGEFCGGFAGIQCADESQYCNFAPATRCGSGDQGGVCVTKPEACIEIYQPVCGCDDKTYGNACSAASAGVSVLYDGECAVQTDAGGPVVDGGSLRSCGGLIGAQCAADEFCNYPIEAKCGSFDLPGVCASKPEACTLEYNPVCGCDGKTYGNACAARAAGISAVATGEC